MLSRNAARGFWPISTSGNCIRSIHQSARKNPFLRVSDEVQEAVYSRKPVVALETTIYTHGFPYPENVALARDLENIVRENGAIPATIGILRGVACVGFSPKELEEFTSSVGKEDVLKISRRDLSYACSTRLAGRSYNGGTTIAGTMILARLAGIRIFATGGLGGVHRGAESSMDISADLTELGRTPVTVVSSGCKSFLDIGRTLEYLETEGVGVATFADGRQGHVDFPGFWTRESGFKSPMVLEDEKHAAAIIHAQNALSLSSGLLFANPIPESAAMDKDEIDAIITQAVIEADAKGMIGKDNTPFILSKIRELTGGDSVIANRALISSNVRRGSLIATELARLEKDTTITSPNLTRPQAAQNIAPAGSEFSNDTLPKSAEASVRGESDILFSTALHKSARIDEQLKPPQSSTLKELSATEPSQLSDQMYRPSKSNKIVVAGAIAMDLACDFDHIGAPGGAQNPQLQTSNPASIKESLGGVGYNVARAAAALGAPVRFFTKVGDDIRGQGALLSLAAHGFSAKDVAVVKAGRTAQYVAVNDGKKDLMIAMSDFALYTHPGDESEAFGQMFAAGASDADFIILDANWSPRKFRSLLKAASQNRSSRPFIALEPVSAPKAAGLFRSEVYADEPESTVFPRHILDLISPNALELAAIHGAASAAGLLETPQWWAVINAIGISSAGARSSFTQLMPPELVDRGIPQQAIQMLPFVPCIATKLGAQGVLLTKLVLEADEKHAGCNPAANAKYMVSHAGRNDLGIRGVYVRHFPPEEALDGSQIVSVNGVGDTFLGALVAGLAAREATAVASLIPLAQRAAMLTLRSTESVSAELSLLKPELQGS